MADPKEVAKALRELQAAGAEIHAAPKPQQGSKIAASVLADLEKGTAVDFTAWVSWTKSF
jgi:hypothetical protein